MSVDQIRLRAETVLEAMSQDSGPADCEPYTGWSVDLARDVLSLLAALVRLGERAAECEEALERIADQQPKTLAMIEANGFVFDDIGRESGNWQHLAFSVYTDLCEVDTIARAALAVSVVEVEEQQ